MKYTLKPTSKFQKDLKRIQKKRSLPVVLPEGFLRIKSRKLI